MYICKSKNKTSVEYDHCLVHEAVILSEVLNLVEIHDYIDEHFDKYEIVGCNTDVIYFGCNRLIEQRNNGKFEDKRFKIGEGEFKMCNFIESECIVVPVLNKDWKLDKSGSYLFNGGGGEGKTEMLIRENVGRKILWLSFENSGVENLNCICKKNEVVDYLDKTIHVALGLRPDGDNNVKDIDFNKFDVVIVDEFFRNTRWLQSKLFYKLKDFNNKIMLIGDHGHNKYIDASNYQ